MEDPKDSKDVYQDYVWKVDKSTVTIVKEETPLSMCNGNTATKIGYPWKVLDFMIHTAVLFMQ